MKLKVILDAVPILILWFLWKRRNNFLHGGLYPSEKVIHEINNTIHKLEINKFPFF